MWYSRNDELHQNEQSRINKTKSNNLDKLVKVIYARKKNIPSRLLAAGDRKYFRRKKQAVQ